MKIIIAGAGIGGLVSALCLSKSGHQVCILEQAPSLTEVGAGIQCGANAQHVLSYLGLNETLNRLASSPKRISFVEHDTSSKLLQIELGETYESEYGHPYLNIHRADLQHILVESVNSNPNCELLLNHQVENIKNSATGVSVSTKNGQSLNADLLIAADGIRSTIKALLFPGQAPRFTGNAAWRVLINADDLAADIKTDQVTNYVGPKKHLVTYPIRNGQQLNFVGIVQTNSRQTNSLQKNNSWLETGEWQRLANDFKDWHPDVDKLIHAMPRENCFLWGLYDHQPISSWFQDRVVLLGDAAHATLPFMAAGAGLAIEDARILQRCLDGHPDIQTALARYESLRKPRTSAIQRMSRKTGWLYHVTNPVAKKLMFKGLRTFKPSPHHRLASYNANTIPI